MTIEAKIVMALTSALSVPIYGEVPAEMPESFVTVEKTGSSLSNHVYSAMLAIQSWASTKTQAATLNESVKNAMMDLYARGDIGLVRLNSDYDYTDTASKRYRYQAVFDLVYGG